MAVDVESKTYYELLGVARDAGIDEIKRAYRDMSRIFHPDSNFYSDIISEAPNERHIAIFKRLALAYETLTDEEKRTRYDQTILNGTLKTWEDQDYVDTPPFSATQFTQSNQATGVSATRNGKTQSFGVVPEDPQADELIIVETLEPLSSLVRKPKLLDQILKLLKLG